MVKIKVSPFGQSSTDQPYEPYVDSLYPWPEDCFVQAGKKGLVVSRTPGKESYRTAFVEAFPNETFIRGEGETLAEAELNAWNKYQTYEKCPKHEYEARGYTNGAGFCKHCNRFKGKVFTGEELGQFCYSCGEGTVHSQNLVQKDNGEWVEEWACENHMKTAQVARFLYLQDTVKEENFTEKEKAEHSRLRWMLGLEEEDPNFNIEQALISLLENLGKPEED